MMTLYDHLISAVTAEDKRRQDEATRRKYRDNPYALAIMIAAAQAAKAEAGNNPSPLAWAKALNHYFTPSRWMTAYFKRIGVHAIPGRDGYTFPEAQP